jgi:hypothetical protein
LIWLSTPATRVPNECRRLSLDALWPPEQPRHLKHNLRGCNSARDQSGSDHENRGPNAISIHQLLLGLVPRIATYARPMQKQDRRCIHWAVN